MKKVNFEPNERVDAPDANAIGDVAAEHIDVLGGALARLNTAGLSDDQRQLAYAESLPAIEVFGEFSVRTFDAQSQPYTIQITKVPRAFYRSEYTKELGAIGGLNVESPTVDLAQFAALPAGESFFLYGRIADVAGVKENRARWRADLNPPREEVYLANTRRLPYFSIRAGTDAPASAGWFPIARITRTSSSEADLRRFAFAHTYSAAFSGAAGIKTTFVTNDVNSLVIAVPTPAFGSGITQNINNAATLIAPAATTLALPLTLQDFVDYSAILSAHADHAAALAQLLQGSAPSEEWQEQIKQLALREPSDSLFDGTTLPSSIASHNYSLAAVLNRLLRLVKVMQMGQTPLVRGDLAQSVADANIAVQNLPLFAHGELGNISLRSLRDTVTIGLHIDAPCEEVIDPESITALDLLTRVFYRMRSASSAVLSAARHTRLTGFIRQPTRALDPRYFGGNASGKGTSGGLSHFGGIAVRGAMPSALPSVQALSSVAKVIAADEKIDSLYRSIDGEGVFLRKDQGAGAMLAWTSAGRGASSIDDGAYSLHVKRVNVTDLPVTFKPEFLAPTADDSLFSIDFSTNPDTRNRLGQHGALFISAGGLAWEDSEFWMFSNPYARLGDANVETIAYSTEFGSSTRAVPYAGEFIEIVVPDGETSAAPIVFRNCSFFRIDSANYGRPEELASMIRVRTTSGASAQAQIIFENCRFSDVELSDNQSDQINFVSSSPQEGRSNLIAIDVGASRAVTFKSCTFSCPHAHGSAAYDDCYFNAYTTTHTAHQREIALPIDRGNVSVSDVCVKVMAERLELLPSGIGLEVVGSSGLSHHISQLTSDDGLPTASGSTFVYSEPGSGASYDVHGFLLREGFLTSFRTEVNGDVRWGYTANVRPMHTIKASEQRNGIKTERAALQACAFIKHTNDRALLPIFASSIDVGQGEHYIVSDGATTRGTASVMHGVKSAQSDRIVSDPSGAYSFAQPYRLPATAPDNRRARDTDASASHQFYTRLYKDLRAEHGLVVESNLGASDRNARQTRGVLRDIVFNGDVTGAEYGNDGRSVEINGHTANFVFAESDERSYVQASAVYLGTPNDEALLPSGRNFFEAVSRRTATHMRLVHALSFDIATQLPTGERFQRRATGLSYFVQATTGAGHSYAGNVMSYLPIDSAPESSTRLPSVFDAASTYDAQRLHTDAFNIYGGADVGFGATGVKSSAPWGSVSTDLVTLNDQTFARGVIALDPFGFLEKNDTSRLHQHEIGYMLRDAIANNVVSGGARRVVRSPFMRATAGLPFEPPGFAFDLQDTMSFNNSEVRFKTACNANHNNLFKTLPRFELVQFSQYPVWLIHCTHYSVEGDMLSSGFVRMSYAHSAPYTGSAFNEQFSLAISPSDQQSIFNGGFAINVDLSQAEFDNKSLSTYGIGFEFVTNVSLTGI